MKASSLRDLRMVNQHIAGATFKQPAEVVEWMVAMQSQVYPMLTDDKQFFFILF